MAGLSGISPEQFKKMSPAARVEELRKALPPSCAEEHPEKTCGRDAKPLTEFLGQFSPAIQAGVLAPLNPRLRHTFFLRMKTPEKQKPEAIVEILLPMPPKETYYLLAHVPDPKRSAVLGRLKISRDRRAREILRAWESAYRNDRFVQVITETVDHPEQDLRAMGNREGRPPNPVPGEFGPLSLHRVEEFRQTSESPLPGWKFYLLDPGENRVKIVWNENSGSIGLFAYRYRKNLRVPLDISGPIDADRASRLLPHLKRLKGKTSESAQALAGLLIELKKLRELR